MDDESVLNELVKARENIKRKFAALKSGDADVQSLVSQTFKPIIEPLTNFSNNLIGNEQQKSEKKKYIHFKDYSADEGCVSNGANVNNNDGGGNVGETYSYKTHPDNGFLTQLNFYDRDRKYGPNQLRDGTIVFGNKAVKFDENTSTLFVDRQPYIITDGLQELIFSKRPEQYTEQDLDVYKSILIQTSAHLNSNGMAIKKGGVKYKDIISKLFTVGGELSITLQKHNLVYWDDPNELVDRLRLLISSRMAGNSGHSNEILSIFEELYEKRFIANIPDV